MPSGHGRTSCCLLRCFFFVCFYFNQLSRSHEGAEGKSVRESKNSFGNSIAGPSAHSAHQCAAFLCLAERSVAERTVDLLRVWPCWRFENVSQWRESEDTDSEDLLNVQVNVLMFTFSPFVLKPSDKQPSQFFRDLKTGSISFVKWHRLRSLTPWRLEPDFVCDEMLKTVPRRPCAAFWCFCWL